MLTQLKKVAPQARYRLQFQKANETGYIASKAITSTQQDQRVIKAIDNLVRHT